jgi:inhibitor of cysteine peptidase
MLTGQAPVDSVEVIMLETFPVQIQLIVKGNLPDSCTTLDQVNQSRNGDIFNVTITTKRPADAVCATVLTPYEKTIPLDVVGLKAGTYTANVNTATVTFELKQDNK